MPISDLQVLVTRSTTELSGSCELVASCHHGLAAHSRSGRRVPVDHYAPALLQTGNTFIATSAGLLVLRGTPPTVADYEGKTARFQESSRLTGSFPLPFPDTSEPNAFSNISPPHKRTS